MTKRIFKAGTGAIFNDEKAQVYGEFIWQLKERTENALTPEQIVEKAKPRTSPIHDFFEWDNTVAAGKYRLWQARYLLGRIEIVIESDEEGDQVRAFHNISVKNEDEGNTKGYVTITDVKENQNYLDAILENAKREIISWQKRYSQYKRLRQFKPLRPLFTAIRQVNA